MIRDQKKIIKLIMLGAILFLVAIWFLISFFEATPKKADFLEEANVVDSSNQEYVYSFSSVNKGNRLSSIDGWIVKKGQPTKLVTLDVRIAVRNKETGSWLILPTEINRREKTTKELDDGNEYTWSGIASRWLNVFLPADKLQEDYEIFACYKINGDEQLVPVELSE